MGLVSGVRTAQAESVRAPDPAASYVTGIDVSHHQSEIDFEAVAEPFIERHQAHFQRPPTPERLAHFLCALAMPVFTPLKARGLSTFGALEGYPYPQVRARAEQTLGS